MAVDSTTAFRNVSQQTVVPLPPGEVLTTPETIERLQIPDEVALRPENVIPFLASQSVKYNEIVNRPEIKTLAAEIPEYQPDRHAPVTALSREEQGALSDWRNQAKTMLTTQSTALSTADSGTPGSSSGGTGGSTGGSSGGSSGSTTGSDDVSKQIQQFLDDAARNNPNAFSTPMNPVDIIGQAMSGQLFQETAETKKKYQELLASAKDPESVIMALTWHESLKTSQILGKSFEALKAQQDGLDKLQAQMDLGGKNVTQADLLKDNMKFGELSSGSSEIFQVIQKFTSDYQQLFELSNSIERDIKQDRSTGIANFKL